MKYLQRYLSLLFALVMCVGLFSVTAHAETYKDFTVDIDYRLYHTNTGSNYGLVISKTIKNFDKYLVESAPVSSVPLDNAMRVEFKAHVVNTDGSLLIKEGDKFDFSISGLILGITTADNGYLWKNTPSYMYVGLVHTDGTWTYLYDVDWVYSAGSQTHAIKVTGIAPKDVRKIVFYEETYQKQQTGVHGVKNNVTLFMGDMGTPTALEVVIESKEIGLLESIGDKLSSGFSGVVDKLTSGFSALGDGIKNVFNSIVELPQKLWNLISDGLKSLFVPSEDSMTAYKDKWDSLLSERLGAVYQVCDIVTDSWSEIGNADLTDTINFPIATINLPGDTQFSFGGYDVKIVPEGFDVLVQAIKLIVGIVCTLAFINGMLKRYDEIMGVEQ